MAVLPLFRRGLGGGFLHLTSYLLLLTSYFLLLTSSIFSSKDFKDEKDSHPDGSPPPLSEGFRPPLTGEPKGV